VVCAAVSVLTQTAIIGLCKVLSIDCELDLDEESGTMFCLLPADLSPEKWQQAQLVLEFSMLDYWILVRMRITNGMLV